MADPDRDLVVASLKKVLELDQDVRRRLRDNEGRVRKAIRELEKGSTIATAMEVTKASEGRQSVNEGLDSLALARHEVRLAITVASLKEGMSIGDLGRAWGISRQLASRYAKEARGGL